MEGHGIFTILEVLLNPQEGLLLLPHDASRRAPTTPLYNLSLLSDARAPSADSADALARSGNWDASEPRLKRVATALHALKCAWGHSVLLRKLESARGTLQEVPLQERLAAYLATRKAVPSIVASQQSRDPRRRAAAVVPVAAPSVPLVAVAGAALPPPPSQPCAAAPPMPASTPSGLPLPTDGWCVPRACLLILPRFC